MDRKGIENDVVKNENYLDELVYFVFIQILLIFLVEV